MRNNILAAVMALVAALGESSTAVGQLSYQASQFGYRPLGRFLMAPPANTFNGGLPTAVAGRFPTAWRLNGGTDFVTVWPRPYPGAVNQAFAPYLPPLGSPATPPVGAPPETAAPPPQIAAPAQVSPPVYNAAATTTTEQTGGATPAAGAGATWTYTVSRSSTQTSSVYTEPYAYSAELSARLTRIARTRGMSAGGQIDVYLRGKTALLQGAVETAADRALLGNVLGLEPDISRIDNRLAVPRYTPTYHANTMPAYGP